MRVFVCCAVLATGLLTASVPADEAKGPYARVASGRASQGDAVKVYTNADLKKMFDISAEEIRGRLPADTAGVPAEGSKEPKPASETDPLEWLQQRQSAQREHGKAVTEAQAAVSAARERLANLERQLLASRNPFSARPQLSDEEKATRQDGSETAAERNERTKELVEKAREDMHAAEAELARLQAERF